MADEAEVLQPEKEKDKKPAGVRVLIGAAFVAGLATGAVVPINEQVVDGVVIDKKVEKSFIVKDKVVPASKKAIQLVDPNDSTKLITDTLYTEEALVLENRGEIIEYIDNAGDSVYLTFLKRSTSDTTWVMGEKLLFAPEIQPPQGQRHKIAVRPNDFSLVAK